MAKNKIKAPQKSETSISLYGEPTIEQNIIHYITKKYDCVPIIEKIYIENYLNSVGREYEVYNCYVKFNFNVGIQNEKPYQIRINKKLIGNYLPLNRLAKLKSLYESD